jgi:hypothetical protein
MIRSSHNDPSRMRQGILPSLLRACLCLLTSSLALATLHAQATATKPLVQNSEDQHLSEIERRVSSLTETLAQTQDALQRSVAELNTLRAEISALRNETSVAQPESHPPAQATGAPEQAEIQALQEQQDLLQAEVKQHEQAKVESASKYNLTVTGLVLVNAFSNAGVVDDAELPSLALVRSPGSSHGSLGATLRQTILGVAAVGPVIAGAQSSALVNADFFGGASTNSFGYTSLAGYVRMRDAQGGLAWTNSKLQLGYTGPLISPLSPTSYATVAQPALSASGNLWTWSPQIQFQQNVQLHDRHGLSLEAGLIDPQSLAYNSIQLDSPVEASRRPGVEGRVAYHADTSATAPARSLTIGVGGYSASQFYNSTTQIHSWAVTGDWQIPLSRWVDVSGEIYRGRSLGGLGGGLYKDILSGTDPITGLSRSVGVDTAGGWSQLKINFSRFVEANAMFGLDDAFSSSFDSVVLPAGSSSLTLSARNSTVTGNLIFRPRSSLIFSPEYRRLVTWHYTGAPYVANIFTLSAGYQF